MSGHSGAFPVVSAPPPHTGPFPISGPPAPPPTAPPPGSIPRLPEAVLRLLAAERTTVDHADAALSDLEARPGWPAGMRNALVYGLYAMVSVLIQTVMVVAVDWRSAAMVLVPCSAALVLVSFALGWLTVGVAFRPPAGQGRPVRTPVIGLMVSMLAITPALAALIFGAA
jgi:hypothetical protein